MQSATHGDQEARARTHYLECVMQFASVKGPGGEKDVGAVLRAFRCRGALLHGTQAAAPGGPQDVPLDVSEASEFRCRNSVIESEGHWRNQGPQHPWMPICTSNTCPLGVLTP